MQSNESIANLKITKILAPVDFSAHSEAAVEHAANLSEKFDATLTLLHVIPVYAPPIPVAAGVNGTLTAPPDEKTQQRVTRALEELAARLAPGRDTECIVQSGDPASLIAEAVKNRGVDFIVMPTHGYGIFRRFVPGSVTTKVLNDVDCPILTGAHVEEIRPHDPQPYERIGCAVDLTEHSAHTLRWASDFAKAYDARLSLIHAIAVSSQATSGAYMTTDFAPLVRRNTEERMQKLIEETKAPVAESVVETGFAETLIPSLAREKELDTLVIGRHNDGGLFTGLAAQAYGLIRHSPCPVISV